MTQKDRKLFHTEAQRHREKTHKPQRRYDDNEEKLSVFILEIIMSKDLGNNVGKDRKY